MEELEKLDMEFFALLELHKKCEKNGETELANNILECIESNRATHEYGVRLLLLSQIYETMPFMN